MGTKSLPELTALICQLKLIHTGTIWLVLRIQISNLVSIAPVTLIRAAILTMKIEAIRIIFGVVPNNGAVKSTIVKTFLATPIKN